MDPYLGEIKLFTGNYAPAGWHICDGSMLSISQYQALYAVLGTKFGGDGVNTFGVPDLQSRLPVGQGAGTGLTPRTLAQSGGSETITLATENLPLHTHPLTASTVTTGSVKAPNNNYLGVLTVSNTAFNTPIGYIPDATTGLTKVTLADGTVSYEGGSQAHNNIMSYMVLNYIICLIGIFPEPN